MPHTAQQTVDFILNEVLTPFTESVLYDDYQEDWERRQEDNEKEEELFNTRYDEATRLIEAVPEMLEALEELVKADNVKMGRKAVALRLDIARAAITKAKGESNHESL